MTKHSGACETIIAHSHAITFARPSAEHVTSATAVVVRRQSALRKSRESKSPPSWYMLRDVIDKGGERRGRALSPVAE
jgi:hypothetical protein